MNDDEQLLLRWRGQVSGPFTLARILQMLDEREIGTWHEVQHEGRWIPLEDILQSRQRDSAPRLAPAPPSQRKQTPIEVPRPTAGGPAPVAPAVAAAAGAPPPPAQSGTQARFHPKSYRLFAGLGLALGFTGAHNFYAGYWGTAVAQIILTALTWWLGFGIIAAWLWAWLELLLVHTDRRGVRME